MSGRNGLIFWIVGIVLIIGFEVQTGKVSYIIMKNLSRGYRNNNPGNLKDTSIPWQGAIGSDGVFEIFDTLENGARAASKDVKNKIARGLDTVEKLIAVYAPTSENDTNSYINKVAYAIGKMPSDRLNWESDKMSLMFAIFRHENGYIHEAEKLQTGVMAA